MDILSAINAVLASTINILPNIAGAIALLIVGWIVGAIIARIARKFFSKIRFDEHISRGRKTAFSISDVFVILLKWTIYIVFIQASVDFLGIAALSTFLQAILIFIPGLVKAIIVIIIGYAIAEYVREQIEKSEIAFYDIVSNALFFIILYISVAMALPQIGIDPFLINGIMLIFIASVSIAIGIAVGYGLKDIVRENFKKYSKQQRNKSAK